MTYQDIKCYKIAKTVTGASSKLEEKTNRDGRESTEKRKGSGNMSWTMFDFNGQRKYLTVSEVHCFLRVARSRDLQTFLFCWFIALTGCRISEALSLSVRNIDFENRNVVIRSLKKRGKRIFRAVPLPSDFLDEVRKATRSGMFQDQRLWSWCRMTGYRKVRDVMEEAGIVGTHATPKGLRHGFGVRAIQSNVPLPLVQRWLGHADIKTTAIYTNALGPEERALASRTWSALNERKREKRALPTAGSEAMDGAPPI